MEAMINDLAARKLRNAKSHFEVMRLVVQVRSYTILYFIRTHHAFIEFSVFYIYHAVGSSAITQACCTINSCCSMFIDSSEGDSYYWQGVSSPARRVKDTSINQPLIVNGIIKLIFIRI